jgi:type IV pilus assembly protein PilZ
MSSTSEISRQGLLSLTIKDKGTLYAAYMSFIKNGGLFIPTPRYYSLGEEVFMLLNLSEENERIPISGKVIWITPSNSEGNRAPGIGVQFDDTDNGLIQKKIETYLAGAMHLEKPTQTM